MVWSSARIAGDTAAAPVKQRTGITFANRRISLPDVRSAKGVPRRNWRKGKGNGENDWSGRPGSNRRPSAPKALLAGLHTDSRLVLSAATDNARSSANTRDSQHRLYHRVLRSDTDSYALSAP